MLLNHCTINVSVSQSSFAMYLGMETGGTSALTVVMSPLSTVEEVIILSLWYTLHSGSLGGCVLGECVLKYDDFWVAFLLVVNTIFLFDGKPLLFQGMAMMFPGLVTKLWVTTGSRLDSCL